MKRLMLLAILAAASACSRPDPVPAADTPAATTTPASSAAPAAGRIDGKVQGGAAAVVVLEPRDATTFPDQREKPVMDQAGLSFGPEMLLVRTGQPVEFRNSDDTLHNVNVKHEETREQAFNVAIPTGGAYDHTFTRDGFYRVGCDIHPSMAASVFAAKTPYTALTAADGRFEFSDIPPGAWTVTVYTGGKRLHKDVDVKGGAIEVLIE